MSSAEGSEAETLPAPAASSASGSLGAPSISTTHAATPLTPGETLLAQEVARSRNFMGLAAALGVIVLLVLPALGGDALAKRVLVATCIVEAAGCGWAFWVLRDEAAYAVWRVLVPGYLGIAAAFSAIYFFGPFSLATAVLPFGLSFFSTGQSWRGTVAVYLTCAGGYLVLGGLTATSLIADRGLIAPVASTHLAQVIFVCLIEALLLFTFLNARRTRAATIAAIERRDQAVRSLAQRDALLQEARQELERALTFAGLGRFSDAVIGSFKLGRLIGRGAMGEVYEAEHKETHAPAAVKLLQIQSLGRPEIVKRFLLEAKIALSLDVPNVVKVLEVGGLEAPMPYIAMERLEGEDLADHLLHQGQLSPRKVITLVREVGSGLEAARAAGIVHRDLKPRNVFLAKQSAGTRAWKILDFGVSKLVDVEGTQTHDRVVGTPGYMAPEQARGEEVSYKSDLYALGVIAYRALTGRPAFSGEAIGDVLHKVLHSMPPRPSALVDVHREVDAVLALAMAKDPRDRPESGAELADQLQAAVEGKLDPKVASRAQRLLDEHPWSEPT